MIIFYKFPALKIDFTLRQPYTSFRDIAFWLGFFCEKTLLTAIKTPLTCSSLRLQFSARRFIPLRFRGKVRGNKSFGFTSLNRICYTTFVGVPFSINLLKASFLTLYNGSHSNNKKIC